MKRILKTKAVSILLMAVLLFSLLSVCAFAEEADDSVYSWDMTTDESMVWNEDREYYRYELPIGYEVDFKFNYYFDGEVSANRTSEYSIMSYARDGEIIALNDYYSNYYYVTDIGRASIEKLAAGNFASARLYEDYGYVSDIDREVLEKLDKLDTGTTVEVSELADLNYYQIRTYDSTDSVYYVYGALYEYDGGMWYLNYDRLSNDYFDADGNFSYRRGSVTIYQVNGSAAYDEIIEAEDSFYYFYEGSEYENDSVFGDFGWNIDGVVFAKVLFWVLFVIVGVALPVVPFVAGIKNSRSPKHSYSRRWLIMSLGSLIWAVLSIAIALILIFE